MSDRIVIVGGGVAAARFVRAYREAGGDAALTMLAAEAASPVQPSSAFEGVLAGGARRPPTCSWSPRAPTKTSRSTFTSNHRNRR